MSGDSQLGDIQFCCILPLEGRLKAAVDLHNRGNNNWLLSLQLHYDGDSVGALSFNLNSYTCEEAESVARNLRSNPFIMREVDEYLWGESD